MDNVQRVKRAAEAERLLKNELYVEAWSAYEQRLLDALASADMEPARLNRLHGYLVAARKARQHLERIVQDGKMAAAEIELDERRSRLARVFRAA